MKLKQNLLLIIAIIFSYSWDLAAQNNVLEQIQELNEPILNQSIRKTQKNRKKIRQLMEGYFQKAGVPLNSYALPFKKGRWKITQGNTTKHSHSLKRKNLFCWDFELIDQKGQMHRKGFKRKKEPRNNYSYGMPIYAVAAGKIWIRKGGTDGVEPSNIIVVKHNDGTRAIYDHIRPAGFAVKKNDRVKKGQLIGYIGYTGTKYPHIHFSVKVKKPDNWTIPIRFKKYYLIKNGINEKITNGVPKHNQIIAASLKEIENPSIP